MATSTLAPALSSVAGSTSASILSRSLRSTSKVHIGLNIRCARVGGVEIPNSKRIEASLQYVHGIGRSKARQILLTIGLQNKVTKELTEEELTSIREEISNNPQEYKIEGDLRRDVASDIRRLKEIQCYRGRRHIANLPCRGQHTKCNARTRKGRKVTVAGKKKAPR
ncbi:hypothetical protein KP509_05G059300 [Ceratopteris richardii]|uniref:30S ribosomal protein S13, chloroplastic n=1 Tax=Ceratopteris richardii TaxID=49495 RepID=A0A8T2UUS1_CERRI|nr:hypothetical protein KP509_05G059300 [Ceratopteris richardii]